MNKSKQPLFKVEAEPAGKIIQKTRYRLHRLHPKITVEESHKQNQPVQYTYYQEPKLTAL